MRFIFLLGMLTVMLALSVLGSPGRTLFAADLPLTSHTAPQPELTVTEILKLTDADWKRRLTPEQYRVLRRQGTEPAFCGGYTAIKHHGDGVYVCVGCGTDLFGSDTKFDSGSGWPSFFRPLPGKIKDIPDNSHGMDRTEVTCAHCGGHLGHVFDDGPAPTRLRYCINAVALDFKPAGPEAK